MIKANELRIGDYIKWSGNIHKVQAIDSNFVMIIKKNLEKKYLKYEDIFPVAIEGQLLLRFGLEKSFSNDYWYSIKFGDKRLSVSILGNVEIEKWDRTMIGFMSICEYVHQLQNLYFCLSGGEELVFSTEP